MTDSPDFTRRLLADAGLRPGMRVLDIGCGSGDVTFLAAALVGATGEVVGVDQDADALARARDRCAPKGSAATAFVQATIAALPSNLNELDAIVGRRVLMYQPDAAEAARLLADRLRPGGVMAFQEHDASMTPASLASFPLHASAQGWLRGMLEREGADPHIGFRLHEILKRAGLVVEHVRAEAIVQTPTQPYALGAIVRACLTRIVGQGVATDEEIGVDTLQDRLDAERTATVAVYIGDMMFGAWARKGE